MMGIPVVGCNRPNGGWPAWRAAGDNRRSSTVDAAKKYKVVGWAPVSEEARAAGGEPVWDVVARNLRAQKTIKPRALNLPQVAGVAGNPGLGSGRI